MKPERMRVILFNRLAETVQTYCEWKRLLRTAPRSRRTREALADFHLAAVDLDIAAGYAESIEAGPPEIVRIAKTAAKRFEMLAGKQTEARFAAMQRSLERAAAVIGRKTAFEAAVYGTRKKGAVA